MKLVKFGVAVEALKEGKMVRRKSWTPEAVFIFMQVPAKIPLNTVKTMQSLPQSVKDEIARRAKDYVGVKLSAHGYNWYENIQYQGQIAAVYEDNTIVGWAASNDDVLAEDWVILD